MNSAYQLEIDDSNNRKRKPNICSLYTITHIIVSMFAIYLSWRCNNGFNLLQFVVALLCPYLYIIWALATRGGCGVFDRPIVRTI
jgi:hypothetical protein